MKIYNVIFPIWFLLFFPPVIFITLFGNYVIDSIVLIACFYLFNISNLQINLKTFYKKSILKVWLYGFLADILGALILFLCTMLEEKIGLSYEITSAISYDPFSHPLAVVIILISMLVASYFIFLFNYKITLVPVIAEARLRFKVALTIAIITTPWTFLLPTKWFY
ncbi:hypothetical protein [Schinkia azotoformans]|uniref:hypothetical protein n=1 Tax=Schinkia azotoformans TaxID=1454 RepID=UPI002DBAC0CD|nr:hypothetical protein [Schinkia azotoformans]MEC1722960.1 hypothetical protein [Schinkia azotoformans]MED4414872.1 hypothetical protein [Schinkia azotoformans]